MRNALVGTWTGTLSAEGVTLRLLIEFTHDAGQLHGTLVSLDQSKRELPLSKIRLQEGEISFVVADARGTFSGEFTYPDAAPAARTIAGRWRQGGFRGDLVLRKGERPLRAILEEDCGTGTRGAAERLVGEWKATLETGSRGLPLTLQVEACGEDERRLDARVLSELQGTTIPVTQLEVEADGTVSFSLSGIGASFTGRLDEYEISGEWSQGGRTLPMVWRVERPRRPQEDESLHDRDYQIRQVTFKSADGIVTLAGTLTAPQGPSRAALILVTGSGPQDRDESIAGHRPFLVLADHLTRQGYAVLRYDDRGVGASGGHFAGSTMEDHRNDLLGAIAWAEAQLDGDLGLLGHSIGASLASEAAADAGIDFLILIAAPAVPGLDLMTAQTRDLALSADLPATAAEALAAFNRSLYEIAIRPGDRETKLRRLRGVIDAAAADPPAGLKAYLPTDAAALTDRLLSPRVQYILQLDPEALLRHLTIPVLAVYGGKDVQVNGVVNSEAMKRALGEAADVRLYAELNHLMQEAGTGNPDEYAVLEQTVSPQVLSTITQWLDGRGY